MLQHIHQAAKKDDIPIQNGKRLTQRRLWWKMGRRAHSRVYGIEIKPYHLDIVGWEVNDFLDMLKSLGFDRFIILQRSNYLRKIVSSRVAQERGFYHVRKTSAPGELKPCKVYIDVRDVGVGKISMSLVEHIKYCDRFYAALNEILADHEKLHLTYDQHVQTDPRVAFRKIAEFLGVNVNTDVDVRLQRTTDIPLNKLIDNYAEVVEVLRNTEFEWMLKDECVSGLQLKSTGMDLKT